MNNMVGYFARMTYGDRAHRDRAVLKIHRGGWGSGLSECTGQKRLVHIIIYKANESFI